MADKEFAGERQYSKEEEELEIKSLRRIIGAYLNYPNAAERDVRRYERSFNKLPSAHKKLLSHLPLKFQQIRLCISRNTSFIMSMLHAFVPPFEMGQDMDVNEDENREDAHEHYHSDISNFADKRIDKEEIEGESSFKSSIPKSHGDDNSEVTKACSSSCSHGHETSFYNLMGPDLHSNVPLLDVDKVRCIVRNIVRDWAPEGQKERDECYKPILEELNRLFPNRTTQSPPCCLVPGAGLGRLALEISSLGFESQGNEFSYYMMICSSFILNHAREANEWTIYPWIHTNCNSLSDEDQLRPVSFPDKLPASAGITEGFSMCGGDFVEVYSDTSQQGAWDAVVTCFFIDTAHNIVEYIEIISKILKDGGVWINMGPLLYHFADSDGDDELSIDLSLEDVKNVAFSFGFEMEVEKMIETTYSANRKSMMQNRYCAALWTMRKKHKSVDK